MSINIEWQVMPPAKGNELEEKPKMFPRITNSEVISELRLAELMAARGSLSRGTAVTALNDLAEVMAELLKEGKTIDIPMLGSFKLSIGTDAEIHPETNRRMHCIEVRGVNFRPCRQFMDAIGNPTFQWKPATGVAIAPMASQLIPRLDDYFQRHDSITRAEFEHLFGLKRTTAYQRLKELMDKGVIEAVGNGRETKYVRICLE